MAGLRRALLAIGLAGLAAGLVGVAMTLSSDHAEDPWLDATLGVFVGWSFIGTGLFAWWRRSSSRFGALMVGVGFAWFAVAMTTSNLPAVFTLGVLLSNLYFGICAHMLVSFPSGRLQTRGERWLIGVIYALCAIGPLPVMLAGDIGGWGCEDCPRSIIHVTDANAFAETADAVLSVLAVVSILLVAARLVTGWRRASAPQRRALAPVLWSGVALTLLLGGVLSADVLGLDALTEALDIAGLVTFASVPYVFLLGLVRSRVSRAGTVAELLTALRDEVGSGDMRDLLASALGDPSLELAYQLESDHRVVDAQGDPLELPAPDDPLRAATDVELDGARVGAIVHDRSLCEEPELLGSVATAAGLAMRNGRLQAELRARVAELSASRARLIEAGVVERRRLERNLHDGAQQRLVALSLTLRLAHGRLREDPDAAEALMWSAQEELTLALAELRELARGIHPAVLSDRGLACALEALAGRSPIPVELDVQPEVRPSEAVEAAVYFVVAEGLTNVAKYAHATSATVRVRCADGIAVVEVHDDGIGGADATRGSGLRGLSDRIAALDGHLAVVSPPGRGTRLRAEIPCQAVNASSAVPT